MNKPPDQRILRYPQGDKEAVLLFPPSMDQVRRPGQLERCLSWNLVWEAEGGIRGVSYQMLQQI